MRTRFHVGYEGTDYYGWQIQPDVPTVQGELVAAAATILDVPEREVELQGASRTDAGAHAVGQVFHVETDVGRTPWEFLHGLNALTGDDITVNRAERVDDDFHARHSAHGKVYRYEIWNHQFRHPLRRRFTWRDRRGYDIGAMRRAARRLEGRHDFDAFRPTHCERGSTERHVENIDIVVDGRRIRFRVEGDSFLRYMVRVMVGTMADVAAGRERLDCIDEAFASGERVDAGVTAPARGLTLVEVNYPDWEWSDPPPRIGGTPTAGDSS